MDIKFDFPLLQEQANADLMDLKDLYLYKSDVAWYINEALNKGKPITGQRRQSLVRLLDETFPIVPVSHETNYLYRGLHNAEIIYTFQDLSQDKRKPYDTISKWLKSNIGNCVIFRSFQSTTYSPSVAASFSDGIILKFVIPPGFPMLAIDSIIEAHDPYFTRENTVEESEYEILLPRDVYFYIKSVRPVHELGKDYTLVTLDPLPCKNRELTVPIQ